MTEKLTKAPLAGLSSQVRATMASLLRMPAEQHKDVAKPASPQAEAQRRRRERERISSSEVSSDV